MGNGIRFYFDEHVPNAASDALRAKGADVLTVAESGRVSYPDDEQLRFATSQRRVVVSHDGDFPRWAADFLHRGEPHADVAYSHPDKYKGNVGGLILALDLIYTAMTPDEMMNHLEYP